MSKIEATYSPEDNKLRFRASERLEKELYERVRAAGFAWAPKQELFVAPAWSPEREDLALELAGEIGDEDTSLVERAEERADRFEEYGEHRTADAESAHAAVAEVAQRFEGGQPILVGHHSEKRARKDAERIQNGMRRAVKMWETAQYWERRAKGAIRSAKYKELPGVRHRRIKGLEADLRKQQRTRAESLLYTELWQGVRDAVDDQSDALRARALSIVNFDHAGFGIWSELSDGKTTPADAAGRMLAQHQKIIERAERWISHLSNRLAYERAMLEDSGGIVVDAKGFDVKPGGQVLSRGRWGVVLRVNKTGGALSSYTVAGRWGKEKVGVEEVSDYKPPSEEDAARVARATKLAPLVNYPGEGFRHLTQAEWDRYSKVTEFSKAHRVAATEKHGAHRLRMAPKPGKPYYDTTGVYITDAPRKDPPGPEGAPRELPEPLPPPSRPERAPSPAAPAQAKIDSLRGALKAGVRVVSADQLFPTPPDLAARMVRLAGVGKGDRVLEPSAGTGNLVRAIEDVGAEAFAVEIDPLLAAAAKAKCCDFLELEPGASFGPVVVVGYDAVVMNPPFRNGQDILHVMHALTFLKPSGGVLVGICAGGPRQEEKLRAMTSRWEELPAGTFEGTSVRAILFVIQT